MKENKISTLEIKRESRKLTYRIKGSFFKTLQYLDPHRNELKEKSAVANFLGEYNNTKLYYMVNRLFVNIVNVLWNPTNYN